MARHPGIPQGFNLQHEPGKPKECTQVVVGTQTIEYEEERETGHGQPPFG